MRRGAWAWPLMAILALPTVGPAQSLWREGAPGASLYADHRARTVNDLVTIIIVEQSSATRSANAKTEKETSRTAALGKFPTLLDPLAKKLVKPVRYAAVRSLFTL